MRVRLEEALLDAASRLEQGSISLREAVDLGEDAFNRHHLGGEGHEERLLASMIIWEEILFDIEALHPRQLPLTSF